MSVICEVIRRRSREAVAPRHRAEGDARVVSLLRVIFQRGAAVLYFYAARFGAGKGDAFIRGRVSLAGRIGLVARDRAEEACLCREDISRGGGGGKVLVTYCASDVILPAPIAMRTPITIRNIIFFRFSMNSPQFSIVSCQT